MLGNDTVRQLAAKFNLPIDQLAEVLAEQLPKTVDEASPDGKLPHSFRLISGNREVARICPQAVISTSIA